MRLPGERYEEIKEIVVKMFEELDISCTPISGFEIAKKLGIITIPYSATKYREKLTSKYEDAICLEKDAIYYIFYNDKKSYERLNWTFLHEIGHLILGHTEHCELAESEANFFAKFAIAPPVLIHRYKLSTVEDIEDRFCISHEAATNALNYYKKWLNVPFIKTYDQRLELLFSSWTYVHYKHINRGNLWHKKSTDSTLQDYAFLRTRYVFLTKKIISFFLKTGNLVINSFQERKYIFRGYLWKKLF